MLIIEAIVASAVLCLLSVECIYTLQRAGYIVRRGYFNIFLTDFFVCLALLEVFLFGLELTRWQYIRYVEAALLAAAALPFIFAKRKVPLVYTNRVRRLILSEFVVTFLITLAVPLYILPIAVPILVLLAFVITLPIEGKINNHYIKLAKTKLKGAEYTKIAVVGSFGKTSVKQILAQLLPDAVASPNSYNTPLGICKFVNNTNFDGVKYVVFEFGARKSGDIMELCHLVEPDFAVFTGVTSQHLETFKTFDNIIRTKREVLCYLSADSTAILNGNNDVARDSVTVGCCRKIVAGVSGHFEATDATFSKKGSAFSLLAKGKMYQLHTPLLGQAHVENIALCLAAVDALGEDVDEALKKVPTLKQIEHRMQLIEGAVTVIDDGYNANLDGIKQMCRTLSALYGNKIVVAQGIVEAGSVTSAINIEAGALLSNACDVLFTVGVNSACLAVGAKHGKAVVLSASTISEAVAVAQQHYDENTFVVFQNDIP
jgi:UDP-N-acetylmuramoyl-tripeptide--D-alanyl-D-alanine ligase